MSRRLTQARTYARLGPTSIARVAAYRLGLKSGRHPVQRLAAPVAQPPYFRAVDAPSLEADPNRAWDDSLWWFGRHSAPLPDSPPDWFSNPFCDAPQPDASLDWWRIPDFGTGDIKGLWELSRMDWVVAWATTAACGDALALDRLNLWLADWADRNPPYKGPNWKCGQEASIRMMHLVAAAWVLGQDQTPEAGLVDLLRAHLQRIAPTMSYAIGQQNNHGTSEAAALFIGGSFLASHDPRADAWARKGRQWLEERAAALIEPDGSFSQYSVTYHRVMLDTYALAEAWRAYRGLPAFSARLQSRLAAATDWLASMTDRATGDAPNIGANDGARFLQLTSSDYRDFRPSVQLAAALFEGADIYGDGPWNIPAAWLGVSRGKPAADQVSKTFDQGGYHVLRGRNTTAVLRYPRFRFRPSQADALHLDLWVDGVNVLRDGGTFSYNVDGAEWFGSTAAHNTVEFDNRNQMPRLGRFLFGNWLRAEAVQKVMITDAGQFAAAGYQDYAGARHHRTVTLAEKALFCRDKISGPFSTAYLRWRLAPGEWREEDLGLTNGQVSLTVETDGIPQKLHLGTTEESRYYLKKQTVPLAYFKIDRPGCVTTKVSF